jgi:hypothetical protein
MLQADVLSQTSEFSEAFRCEALWVYQKVTGAPAAGGSRQGASAPGHFDCIQTYVRFLIDAGQRLWSLAGGCFSRPRQEGGRCHNVNANQIAMRQEMVVTGNERNFGCGGKRREFSIIRIFDEGKVVGIDTGGKLSLWAKETSELIPTEVWNPAQNKLGLTPGRFVPNQLKTSLSDSGEDTRRCAFRVESGGYEDIRVDDNPIHSGVIPRLLSDGLTGASVNDSHLSSSS